MEADRVKLPNRRYIRHTKRGAFGTASLRLAYPKQSFGLCLNESPEGKRRSRSFVLLRFSHLTEREIFL
jgi:hypothetical protein